MKEEITINIEQYRISKLTSIADFIAIQCIYEKKYEFLRMIIGYNVVDWEFLEKELYIKITGDSFEDIMPRQKMLDIFQTKDEQTVAKWIDSWVNLFPKGVKSGGYYVKSNAQDCLKKMIKFIKVRRYSKEQIFQATKNYVDRKAKENYAYMMRADYFIEKDGVSALATEISSLGEKEEVVSINKML